MQPAAAANTVNVPTIDLDALQQLKPGEAPPAALVEEVASACAEWGFFQVINHGVDRELCMRAEEQQRQFFALPAASKEPIRRSAANARGWYNDELTKQRRDWKEGLDFGSTPSMDWALQMRMRPTATSTATIDSRPPTSSPNSPSNARVL